MSIIKLFQLKRLKLFLWLIGIIFWIWFVTNGSPSYNAYDWPLMHQIPAVAKQALIEGEIPFYAAYFPEEIKYSAFWHGGDQVLADPQMLLSPQIILLKWISVKSFIVFQLLLLYSLGFTGACALARKIKMSNFSFVLTFLMYTLGGYFTSKIAVGHLLNGGFFLWTWVLYFSWKIFEHDSRLVRQVCWLAAIPAFVLLQGNTHIYFHMLMFIGLCAILNWKTMKYFLGSIVVSLPLSAFRLIPIALVSSYSQGERVAYLGFLDFHFNWELPRVFWAKLPIVYSWLSGLVESLAILRGPWYLNGNSWWELDAFLGVIGVVIIIIGLGWLIRQVKSWNWQDPQSKLVLAGSIFFILSLGPFYSLIINRLVVPLGLPVFERIPSRLFIVPYLLLIFFGAHGFGQWLEQLQYKRIFLLKRIIILALAFGLFSHALLWQVKEAERLYDFNERAPALRNLTFKAVIINKPVENIYFNAILYSFIISSLSWILLFACLTIDYRRNKNAT